MCCSHTHGVRAWAFSRKTSPLPLPPVYLLPLFSILAGCAVTGEDAAINSTPEQVLVSSVPTQSQSRPQHPRPPAADAIVSGAVQDRTPDTKPQPRSYDNVWDRVRDRFALPELDDKYTRKYEHWYTKHNRHVVYLGAQADPYIFYIVEEVEKRNLPSELALLPAIESAYKPRAHSHANAAGLWQFIPGTARLYGLKQNRWYDGRLDVMQSTRAALDYLEDLHRKFQDWPLALAAYNAGEGTIRRALEYNAKKKRPLEYSSLKLRTETTHYVRKLIALRNVVRNPRHYGLTLPHIANRPYFAEVDTRGQIDLPTVTDASAIPLEELRKLNPAFKRRATAPDGPHSLLVPVKYLTRATNAINSLLPGTRLRWRLHNIVRGENLGVIARRYDVGIDAIVEANRNKVNGTIIRAGDTLQIPLSAQPLTRTIAASGTGDSSSIIYTVQHGDTLWTISRRYNTSTANLAKWNRIQDMNKLALGQKIRILRN